MPRVVPSQIVELIDQVIPSAKNNKSFYLERDHSAPCAAIINLFEQLPSELLVLPSSKYSELMLAVSSIKTALEIWRNLSHRLGIIPGLGDLNPVSVLRNIMLMCPDEFPSKDIAKMRFIDDIELRANLELDISATNQALSNGEWKAATVLAGSIIEALLLWKLNQYNQEEVRKAVKSLFDEDTLTKEPDRSLDKWQLHSFIEVAAKLEIISKDTAQQARLAREYRNLIHPGREKRLGQKCDRGTAFAAVAAVEHVITDLSCKSAS
jgi:hypothetical protein